MMSETVVTMDGSSNSASNNPRQHQPTVKTEPGQPGVRSGIRLNISHFKTIPGITKLVQLVSSTAVHVFCPFARAARVTTRSACRLRTNWRALP